MIVLITGASGSGKSAYGEELCLRLSGDEKKTYLATMYPYGEETLDKINRHKQMRAGKGFETIECYCNLKEVVSNVGHTVLLECMSNLLANELYMEHGAKEKAFEEIMQGILLLSRACKNLIIISNEVFNDSMPADIEMKHYIQLLGRLNQEIANQADVVCEVVYSIPVFWKGRIDCDLEWM